MEVLIWDCLFFQQSASLAGTFSFRQSRRGQTVRVLVGKIACKVPKRHEKARNPFEMDFENLSVARNWRRFIAFAFKLAHGLHFLKRAAGEHARTAQGTNENEKDRSHHQAVQAR
jgi:hypothetical protein